MTSSSTAETQRSISCKRLQEVPERLRTAGLKLKPSKCYLFQKSVHFLGHIIWRGNRSSKDTVRQRVANSNLHWGNATILGFSHLLPQVHEELCSDCSTTLSPQIWNEKSEVEHRPSSKLVNADALSRIPCKQCGLQEKLKETPVEAVTMSYRLKVVH